jgi:Cu/Ag efflux protein CusF
MISFESAAGGDSVENMIAILVVALTSLALNGLSFAQTKPAPPATPATEKKTEAERAQATVLTGKVTSVDAKAGKLTVKTKDKEVNMTTDSKSTKAALEKLKVGDTAKVFERGGNVIAASPVKAESNTKAVK